MPFLLVPVFAAVGFGTAAIGGVFGTLSAAAIAANVAFTAITLGANFALQSSAQRKAKKAARRNALNGQGQSQQQTVRLSVGPRMRYYGRVKVAGSLVFIETRDQWIHQCVVFNSGTLTEFEEFFVGGRPVLIDADGCVTQPPYFIGADTDPNLRSRVRIESRRGYAEQPVSVVLSGAYPDDWTADHRLNGLAYAVMACKQVAADQYQNVYSSQIPALTTILRGVAVFDPRDSEQSSDDPDSWRFTDNPALCALDYIAVGMRVNRGAIDQASFAAGADICDQTVPLKGGGVERRYRLAGGYSYDEEPAQVVQRILDTFRAQLRLDDQGRIALIVAQWEEPDVEIPPDAIVSTRIERRQGLLNEFNAVKVLFTSPAHGWQEAQAHTIRDEEAVQRLGREVVDETRLPMVFSHTQAQRIAKIELYEDNPEWLGELVCHGGPALALRGKRVFWLRDPDIGLYIAARITRFTLAKDLSTATIGWESIDPSAYEWDPAVDEGPPPVVAPDTSTDPLNPGPPNTLASETEADGTEVNKIRAALRWAATPRTGQVYDLRYRRRPADSWTLVTGLTAEEYATPALPAGEGSWDWEVRLRTVEGGVSTWAAGSFADTPTISSEAIAAPTELRATPAVLKVALSVRQSATPRAWQVQWSVVAPGDPPAWPGSASARAAPAAIATATATAAAGLRDVYARALSPTGAAFSVPIGPLQVEVEDTPPPGTGGGDGQSGDGASNGGPGSGDVPGSTSSMGGAADGLSGDGTGGLY